MMGGWGNMMGYGGYGSGGYATIEEREVRVVSPGYMRSEKIAFDEKHYEKLAQEGKTVIFVLFTARLYCIIRYHKRNS